MGVKNLWDILESCKQTLPLHHLQNKRLCVDLSCWLIQLQNANKSPHCIKDKLYLKSLFHRVRALIALNCSLVFVTDGSIPSIKLAAYRRRLGLVLEDIQETTSQTVQSLRRNMGSEFSCMIKEAKALGLALGIPYLDGIEEAEAQCASLNSASLCDGCFTLDSDIFLFGARTVYKDIVIGEGGYVTCYEMGDIERKLGYGRKSLISLALLLGSDYSQGVRGLGREAACQIVKSIGEDNVLRYVVSEELTFARKSKGTKKPAKALNNVVNKENAPQNKQCIKASDENSGSKDQFVQVISAYMSPKCHCPDSAVVQRVCVHLPFLRTQFQRICAHSFGWTPEQTDQYILPKIAERDLRRFANLRAKSSELGAKIPLEKMPIPCPIAAIVKPRRVQKRDCYEVSWNGVEGLQTSIVPSDLVESACPEKIAEFMEKKVEEKKQSRRPRPRKSTKAADVSEVGLHLQDLHLNNESESNASLNTIDYRHSANLNIESSSNFIDTASSHHPMTALGNVDHEIIDLSTPSSCASKVANLRKNVSLPVDVIDLSESETDTTPEHEKKARELRLFIEPVDVINLSELETNTTPEHEKKARELRLFIESIKGDLY